MARAICLRLLTERPRTRTELEQAMRRREVPTAAATTVLDRFTEVGLIDDAAFAAAWVESRSAGRGLARRALSGELRRKGIDGEVAQQALEQIDGDSELAAARALVARRLPRTAGLEPQVRLRRLAGMLARKGYPGEVAGRVVREALAAEGSDLDAIGLEGVDPRVVDLDAVDAVAVASRTDDLDAADAELGTQRR